MRIVTVPRLVPRAGLAVLGVGAVVAVALLPSGGGGVATAAASKPTQTVTVTRTVTSPPQTVTVTQPAQTVTVTAPPVTQTVTVTAPATSTTTVPTTEPTTTATTTAGACPVSGANKPGAADGNGGCFPGPGNAGIPAGTTLTAYTGPTTITTANTKLDAISTDSRLYIDAPGVTITRSSLRGGVEIQSGGPSILDSFVSSNDFDRSLNGESSTSQFTVQRSEIKGGNQSSGGGWCHAGCVVTDNWIHNDTVLPANSTAHMSAWRMDQSTYLAHNTLACELQPTQADGGCSADLTGYGDFSPVINNTMDRNLFVANPTGVAFCSYGGSSGEGGGKPYGDATHDIRFTNNVFQRGSNNQCGAYRAVGDYNPAKPGNIPGAGNGNDWAAANNRYDDGVLMGPADFGG